MSIICITLNSSANACEILQIHTNLEVIKPDGLAAIRVVPKPDMPQSLMDVQLYDIYYVFSVVSRTDYILLCLCNCTYRYEHIISINALPTLPNHV